MNFAEGNGNEDKNDENKILESCDLNCLFLMMTIMSCNFQYKDVLSRAEMTAFCMFIL